MVLEDVVMGQCIFRGNLGFYCFGGMVLEKGEMCAQRCSVVVIFNG